MKHRLASRVAFLLWFAVGLGVCGSGSTPPARGIDTQLTFDVAVPLETAADAEVWLSGNHAALGKWNGAGVKLSRTPDGRYAGSFSVPAGTVLEYKVTRGVWETVE